MIRVLIVNKPPFACHTLAAVLDDEPEIQVIGCATSENEVRDLAPKSDIILVGTTEAASRVLEAFDAMPETRPSGYVLVLGLTESTKRLLDYLQVDRDEYILDDGMVGDLFKQIREVYQGQRQGTQKIASKAEARLASYARLLEYVRKRKREHHKHQ